MTRTDQDQVYERAAELFALMSAPDRLRLVRRLSAGERSLAELMDGTGIEAAQLSRHLNALCQSGLLDWRSDGARVLYHLADDRLNLLMQYFASHEASGGAAG